MSDNENALFADLTIVNSFGLHARTAAKIAEAAGNAEKGVYIVKDGVKADASSIIDLLSLAAHEGSEIRVEIDSGTDKSVMEAIINMVNDGFGE